MNLFYKQSLYFLFSVGTLTGCYRSYYPESSQIGVLTAIPTVPHQSKVEVYFPGEYPEDKDFIKVKVLEVVSSQYYNNNDYATLTKSSLAYPSLIDQIRQKGQEEGVDAVLIIDRASLVSNNVVSTSIETNTSLAAVGIKYKKNMTDLDQYVQRKKLFIADSTNQFSWKPLLDYELDLVGKVVKTSGNDSPVNQKLASSFIQKYSPDFLIKEENADWLYLLDEFGLLKKRKYKPQDMVVNLFYNNQKLVDKILLSFPSAYDKDKELIALKYNGQKQLTGFEVTQKKRMVLRGTYTYDSNQRLVSQEISKISNGTEKPFMKVENEFFPQNYAATLK